MTPVTIRAYEERLVDKFLESLNVYWSALLTVNGLLLTFFSIEALSSEENTLFFTYALVASCTLSVWLLVLNFRTIRKNYEQLGKLDGSDAPDVPEEILSKVKSQSQMRRLVDEYMSEWKQKNLNEASRRQTGLTTRETVVESLLILETLLVALILATG